MAARYYITLPDASRARGTDARFAFSAVGAEGFAEQLQDALRSDRLFERWRAVVFSWINWKDAATRQAGWDKAMADPRMAEFSPVTTGAVVPLPPAIIMAVPAFAPDPI